MTGAVRFSDNGVALGLVALTSGAASLMAAALAAGTHTVSVVWDSGTAAAQIVVVVGQARTVTALSLNSGTASAVVLGGAARRGHADGHRTIGKRRE